jgi:hypothetical protein
VSPALDGISCWLSTSGVMLTLDQIEDLADAPLPLPPAPERHEGRSARSVRPRVIQAAPQLPTVASSPVVSELPVGFESLQILGNLGFYWLRRLDT